MNLQQMKNGIWFEQIDMEQSFGYSIEFRGFKSHVRIIVKII